VSAYFWGVNGFALAVPQALAGVLSIPLLYSMVKRQFGAWAGLISALVLAITPVTVSTERNNTIDGLLLFVLLLATWAFLRAVRLGRCRRVLTCRSSTILVRQHPTDNGAQASPDDHQQRQ